MKVVVNHIAQHIHVMHPARIARRMPPERWLRLRQVQHLCRRLARRRSALARRLASLEASRITSAAPSTPPAQPASRGSRNITAWVLKAESKKPPRKAALGVRVGYAPLRANRQHQATLLTPTTMHAALTGRKVVTVDGTR
jgi:hypothetical protein